jgi:di/tricarboxylate transporter
MVIPIAVTASAELCVSPQPMVTGVAVAAAASLLTPIATPANMMVMEPGRYRFGDCWRLGVPMLALSALAGILLVPVIWPF